MTRTLALPSLARNSFVSVLLCFAAALSVPEARADLPKKHVIVASHPLATQAGLEMLRQGGSAVDAAIAAQMVMTLVEPQSSGIGGGLFLLHWKKRTSHLVAYDGRETAPQSVTPNLFLSQDGKPMNYIEAVVGGRSVGVPGAIAALWMAHQEQGKLPWAKLFDPAIALAEGGFKVSPRLAKVIRLFPSLALIPGTRDYFMPGGSPLSEGDILRNPAYADALRRIAAEGPKAFYQGPIAQSIVDAVSNADRAAVKLTLTDISSYRAKKRTPVCGTYRTYRICGMAPPSSGGIAALQILKMLERFDMRQLPPNSPSAIHIFTEAQRLAFADRAAYLADPDFVPVPVKGLISAKYLAARSNLLSLTAVMDRKSIAPGMPAGANRTLRRLRIPDHSKPSTAHVSIVDAAGNAVAMTTTVEGAFGSHLMASGFILNNELTDFNFAPAQDNRRFANAPDAGKRPLSSMTPTLVFDSKGRLFAIVGSPGGWRIIPYVTKTLIGLIDWNLDMAAAVALPNVTSRSGPTELERDKNLEKIEARLQALGHEVKFVEQTSGINAVRVTPEGFDAAADPRREGYVGAD